MKFPELENLFRRMVLTILNPDLAPLPEDLSGVQNWQFPPESVRLTYASSGQPGFKPEEDVVFLSLFEKTDPYGNYVDRQEEYDPARDTVMMKRARTRVWDVFITAYGPGAYETINNIKDGFFLESIRRIFSEWSVFFIPNVPQARRAPENRNGRWWNRWDMTLSFNELYLPQPEDVGKVEEVPLGVSVKI